MIHPQYQLDRRQWLRVSAAGVLGTTLPLAPHTTFAASSATDRAKSVLIVELSGGPSQLDMLDPKPDAPAEIRGEFSSIETVVPGVADQP